MSDPRVKARKLLLAWALYLAWTWLSVGNVTAAAHESEPEELPILREWRGDYPVTELHRLDAVGMALAAISRAGVTSIEVGNERISMAGKRHPRGLDPLNATYTLDGQSISLQNGRSEIPISPDSATKIRTFIAGKPAAGDLDGDGDADVAVFLVRDGGGSGTFYYAAVALNVDGRYRGTNAVLLGDRVALKDMTIHNGMVIVRYADRRHHEPMSSDPAVEKRLPLTVVEGTLRALKPLAGVRPKGNCRSDFILVESPVWGETIASPLTVRGKARGTWFFEGDFPIVLEDMKGNVIARGFVTAKGEWMTEEFVAFEGTLAFKKPAGVDSAILVFKKDNPTGRPKFDDEMGIFVFLK